MRRWRTTEVRETESLGQTLAAELRPNGVLLLNGDLGAGKTVLTRGVAAGLGVDPSNIQSPTFTIIREHLSSSDRLIHIDLYRLDSEQAEALGLEEILAGPGVKVVEWAERLGCPLPGAVRLELRRGSETEERFIEEMDEI